MPAGDGTGPSGQGPMTGWGLGRCAGPGGGRFWRGRGPGRGFGFGRWLGGQVARPLTAEQEKGWLRRQAELLKGRLDEVTGRLGELEKEGK